LYDAMDRNYVEEKNAFLTGEIEDFGDLVLDV
jgi:hypothetical protein